MKHHIKLCSALAGDYLICVLVSFGAITNDHRLDALKQQKSIFSRSCRPEIQNQSVRRAGLLSAHGRSVLCLFSFLVVTSNLWLVVTSLQLLLP